MQRPSGRQSSRGIRSNSGQMNAASGSGRGAASSSTRGSARSSARASARGSTRGSGSARDAAEPPARPARKSKAGGGKELVICSVVILVLVVVCGVLYVRNSQKMQEQKAEATQLRRAHETNLDRAFTAFTKAQSIGFEFVSGKNKDATRESLFSGLQGDPNIYNVLFEWSYKKRSQNIPIQHFLNDDTEHKSVSQTPKGTVKEGINMVYGYTSNGQPVYIATKFFPPPPEDKSNLGGQIMVIVNAEPEGRLPGSAAPKTE